MNLNSDLCLWCEICIKYSLENYWKNISLYGTERLNQKLKHRETIIYMHNFNYNWYTNYLRVCNQMCKQLLSLAVRGIIEWSAFLLR